MIDPRFLNVLRHIVERLRDSDIVWAVTGSLGMALQSIDILVHDIDLQTDEQGAYAIERQLAEYVVKPVHYLQSDRMRSHLGELDINGIQVEIIGAIQKRIDEQTWEEPVNVAEHWQCVELDGMRIPVLSLEYEYEAYSKMGRMEKAQKIKEWLQSR
jgi:hypothetical protein